MTYTAEELARIGHGAIQVEASTEEHPILVFLAGPISYWWGEDNGVKRFGTPMHQEYLQFRDATEAACVLAGYAVYMPYKALRGPWHDDLQWINTVAIQRSSILLDLNLQGVPAPGTEDEKRLARKWAVPILHAGRFYGPTRIDTLMEDIFTCVNSDRAGTLETYYEGD